MSVEEALNEARQRDEARALAGFDQAALDAAARQGLGNGAFEDGEEEGQSVVEEFFAPNGGEVESSSPVSPHQDRAHSTLQAKLDAKVSAAVA